MMDDFIYLRYLGVHFGTTYIKIGAMLEVPRIVKFIDTVSRMAVARGWREEAGKQCECIQYHLIIHLKMVKMVHFVMHTSPQHRKGGSWGKTTAQEVPRWKGLSLNKQFPDGQAHEMHPPGLRLT